MVDLHLQIRVRDLLRPQTQHSNGLPDSVLLVFVKTTKGGNTLLPHGHCGITLSNPTPTTTFLTEERFVTVDVKSSDGRTTKPNSKAVTC